MYCDSFCVFSVWNPRQLVSAGVEQHFESEFQPAFDQCLKNYDRSEEEEKTFAKTKLVVDKVVDYINRGMDQSGFVTVSSSQFSLMKMMELVIEHFHLNLPVAENDEKAWVELKEVCFFCLARYSILAIIS